ncbi:DUF1553 domain-containing protein, partial [Planctomycetaceae bacterium]|nr:DUF1553 domain-containing protein [Planctomycetaceae bacterium]
TRMVDLPLASQKIVTVYKDAETVVKEREAEVKTFREQRKRKVAEQQRDQISKYMLAVWKHNQRKNSGNKQNLDQFAAEFQLEKNWLKRWDKFLDKNNNDQKKIAALDAWRNLPNTDKNTTEPSANVIAATSEFQDAVNEFLDLRDGKSSVQKGQALYTSGKVNQKRPLVDIRVDLQGSRQLFLVMTNAGDGDNSDWGDWLDPKLISSESQQSLVDLNWKSATATHHSVRKNLNCAGKPLKVNGKLYEVGIGTHSLSVIEYELPAGVTHFVAQGGLDGSGVGSVEFRVYNVLPADIELKPNSAEEKARENVLKVVFAEKGLFGLDDKELTSYLDEQQAIELAHLQTHVEEAQKVLPPAPPMAHVVQDNGTKNHKIYIRGNPTQPGEEAPRQFLRILTGEDRTPFTEGSGRLELAEAIASPDNPLTARVIVNRVWQHHFGSGLVGTASNFGELGDRPTHPELLDWLTVRFVESGWSLKWLHREILASATWQRASDIDEAAMVIDPENRLLWRMARRRLEVEAWRDALLAVSGNLDSTMGGPTVKLADSNNYRRTVYGAISRHELNGLLRLFDFPDANVTSAARTETTVPQQQLFVLNSDFVVKQAKALVDRIRKEAGGNGQTQITLAHQILFGRNPDDVELALGLEFVSRKHNPDDKLSVWEQYAQALLGSNEFMYID